MRFSAATHSAQFMLSLTTASRSGVRVVKSSFQAAGATVGISAVEEATALVARSSSGQGGATMAAGGHAKHIVLEFSGVVV